MPTRRTSAAAASWHRPLPRPNRGTSAQARNATCRAARCPRASPRRRSRMSAYGRSPSSRPQDTGGPGQADGCPPGRRVPGDRQGAVRARFLDPLAAVGGHSAQRPDDRRTRQLGHSGPCSPSTPTRRTWPAPIPTMSKRIIRPTGFFRVKSKTVVALAERSVRPVRMRGADGAGRPGDPARCRAENRQRRPQRRLRLARAARRHSRRPHQPAARAHQTKGPGDRWRPNFVPCCPKTGVGAAQPAHDPARPACLYRPPAPVPRVHPGRLLPVGGAAAGLDRPGQRRLTPAKPAAGEAGCAGAMGRPNRRNGRQPAGSAGRTGADQPFQPATGHSERSLDFGEVDGVALFVGGREFGQDAGDTPRQFAERARNGGEFGGGTHAAQHGPAVRLSAQKRARPGKRPALDLPGAARAPAQRRLCLH